LAAFGQGIYKKNPRWSLAPTLYSFIIEYNNKGKKKAVLVYHIYYPIDKKGKIHDWERIEIHLTNVGSLEKSEKIENIVITNHHKHVFLKSGQNASFINTVRGKHVLIWQAKWRRDKRVAKNQDKNGGELYFVNHNKFKKMLNNINNEAKVKSLNGEELMFHYIFYEESDAELSKILKAWTSPQYNETDYFKKYTYDPNYGYRKPKLNHVKRLTYRIDDIFKIVKTQMARDNEMINQNWGDYSLTGKGA